MCSPPPQSLASYFCFFASQIFVEPNHSFSLAPGKHPFSFLYFFLLLRSRLLKEYIVVRVTCALFSAFALVVSFYCPTNIYPPWSYARPLFTTPFLVRYFPNFVLNFLRFHKLRLCLVPFPFFSFRKTGFFACNSNFFRFIRFSSPQLVSPQPSPFPFPCIGLSPLGLLSAYCFAFCLLLLAPLFRTSFDPPPTFQDEWARVTVSFFAWTVGSPLSPQFGEIIWFGFSTLPFLPLFSPFFCFFEFPADLF